MESTYSPAILEEAVQKKWLSEQTFAVKEDLTKEKFFCLAMFPYPSGKLHMGHVRNYSIADVIARYQRMLGKNVLHPMGWDAFGLPAENAARAHNTQPAKWTYANIEQMREQFKRLGFSYDWDREIATCKPDYYRWEQWLFTRLFEKGLVYKKNAMVNWDPVDETVLANEQVIDGRGWRSGALVERREIPQWFIKITAYADELLQDLQHLEEWPEQVRSMQKHWIGRSEGVEITFEVEGLQTPLQVYTTRPDTLMGVTYLALAPQHTLVQQQLEAHPELLPFIEECQHIQVSEAAMATLTKKGMDIGLRAIHPITGETIPIWTANFVLLEYGSGAVMSVPGHDARDFEFATAYGLPIQQVIEPNHGEPVDLTQQAFTGQGVLINSGQWDGLPSEKACHTIIKALEAINKGQGQVHYRLRDWGISRQRYWGTPVPVIHCMQCGPQAVPPHDLPVVLPEDVDLSGNDSPLKHWDDFVNVPCPHCQQPAKRDTDTFDTFMESSWYYARFASFDQHSAMLDDRAKYWTPVDHYVGGIEHAVMHLLYARFFHKLLRDEGLLNSDEPFKRLLTQGMVLKDGTKMSKSKGNVVDPQTLIDQYGADTVRLFVLFAAPPEQSLEWSDSGVEGAYRFLKRLWIFAVEHGEAIKSLNALQSPTDWERIPAELRTVRQTMHQTLQQANGDIAKSQLNTVVSAAMKLLNLLQKLPQDTQRPTQCLRQEGLSLLLRLLAPITPHITQTLWQDLDFGTLIMDAPWPKVDAKALQSDSMALMIQINGKVRGKMHVPCDADETTIQQLALAHEKVKTQLQDKACRKIIVVPKRLVNVVLGDKT